jgi:GTPase SAR1 family protein
MALFKKTEMAPAFLKLGIYGDAGSGKTYTASQIAKGLSLMTAARNGGKKPPVMFLDTETGSAFVKPMFEKAGIEFLTPEEPTRAFTDLLAAVSEAEAAGAILIVDSMTHFWEEIREAYTQAKRERLKKPYAKLELPDWNIIKPEWAKFTTAFLNASAHIILCGRAGSVYEFQDRDDESNRKEMITVGTRMAAEKGMGYEPNILVEMTSRQATGRDKKKTIIRTATILKDRFDVLDGLQFNDPKFENFLPHINLLNIGGKHSGINGSRTSKELFPSEADPRDTSSIRRAIVVEDAKDLLIKHIPGMSNADKTKKSDLIRKHFGANWVEVESLMPLDDLKAGYASLKAELEPEAPDTTSTLDDSIPALEKTEEAEDIDDRAIILHDFEDALSAFPGNSTRIAQLRKSWQPAFESNGFDPAWMAKVDVAVVKAKKAKPVGLKAQLQTSVENERAEAAE